jgi:hypothetical protein
VANYSFGSSTINHVEVADAADPNQSRRPANPLGAYRASARGTTDLWVTS